MWRGKRKSFSRAPVRRRFGPRLHNVSRPGRWNVGQIFVDAVRTLDNSSGAEQVIYTKLADIAVSFDTGSGSGIIRAVGEMQRTLEIGGIVLQHGLFPTEGPGGTSAIENGYFYEYNALVVDRLVADAGAVTTPASIQLFSPFINTVPVVEVGTAQPSAEAEAVGMPTRILWTRCEEHFSLAGQIPDDQEGVLYYPNGQKVTLHRPTLNRRLRIRLNEEQGLFFVTVFRNSPTFSANTDQRQFVQWIRGHLYYRFRQ